MNATATFTSAAWTRRSSTESILSIQGRETDDPEVSRMVPAAHGPGQEDQTDILILDLFRLNYDLEDNIDVARDTSDTDAGECMEYEPVTESEDEAPVECDDTDITDEEIIQTKVIEVSVVEDRDLVFADSEPTDSAESDSEIDFNDYYQCAQCNAHNDNPLFRYCDKCFRSRKHFFPPRPKRKLKRRPGTQPLSQDSGVDICLSQDLDPGTSIPDKSTSNTEQYSSKSPRARKIRSRIDRVSSDTDVDELPPAKKSRYESFDKDSKANCVYSDDDFAGQSSQNGLDFVSIPDETVKARSTSSDRKPTVDSVKSNNDFVVKAKNRLDLNCNPEETEKSTTKYSDDDFAGQSSSHDILDIDTIQNKCRKRSRSSESNRDPKRTKHESDNDESTVQTLVKTISDPSITIEDSVKLTKKVLANTLKEMVTKDSKENNNMCFICFAEPKSGVFVHGRIAHICCCYKCAMKVWSTAKRCPICNRKVSNVLKAVIS